MGVVSMSEGAFRERLVAEHFVWEESIGAAMARMGFAQADPIRSPARAQDLILRQRVRGYRAGDLEAAFPDLELEEGYLFAYGFMGTELWACLCRPATKAPSGLELAALEAVKELGSGHPRAIAERLGRGAVTNAWGGRSTAAKRALEALHEAGRLRVMRRENGIRVYGLPRGGKAATQMSGEARYRRILRATLKVFGPTERRFLLSELAAHQKLVPGRRDRAAALERLVEEGEAEEVDVGGVRYLWLRDGAAAPGGRRPLRILAPFDPLVRDRKRFERLWGWEYRFEAYLPEAKRRRGYYAMPVLWRDAVVGWANARVDGERLKVDFGYAGANPQSRAFRSAAETEAADLARFLGLDEGAVEMRWPA